MPSIKAITEMPKKRNTIRLMPLTKMEFLKKAQCLRPDLVEAISAARACDKAAQLPAQIRTSDLRQIRMLVCEKKSGYRTA